MKRSIPFMAAGVMSLAFVSPAFAQGHGPEAGGFRSIARLCATDQQWTTDRMGERLAQRLNLTDQQKPALKALQDAIAKAKGDAKAALCAATPDLSTLPARMAFAQKRLQARLDGMKAVQPKLEAFYATLTGEQQVELNELWHHHGMRGERGGEGERHWHGGGEWRMRDGGGRGFGGGEDFDH
ncbi:MAG: Spy/CpxP family protein refolding chaperone [Hyphomicrobiales bacterium]|nr:Spy/CpxP family protein refolding chaperone [Hyphomicrobiales bacterium]